MTKLQTLLVSAAAGVAALTASGVASALTIYNLGTISSSTTVSGSDPYTSNETVEFKFTVNTPYRFTFTDSGTGGTFPFPITESASGTAGSYTETYGPFPVHGTLSYSLTTSIPEPAAWAMMLVGFGGVGAAMRRRVLKSADSVA